MLQDSATNQENYERFITKVLESKIIWGLKTHEGVWATCPSNDFEETNVYVFWSDEAYAKRHAKNEWVEYAPTAIPLDLFIDKWLKGMHQDNHLVGPNWDAHLFGKEVEPIEIAKLLTGS